MKKEPWWPKFEKLCVAEGIKIKSSSSDQSVRSNNQLKHQQRQPNEIITNNMAYIQNNINLNKQQEQKPPILQRTVKKTKPELNYPKCKALYDYNASDNDELSFQEGDIIYILQEGKKNFFFLKQTFRPFCNLRRSWLVEGYLQE